MKYEQLARIQVGARSVEGAIVRNSLFVAGTPFGNNLIPDEYNEYTDKAGPLRVNVTGIPYTEAGHTSDHEIKIRIYTLTVAQALNRQRKEGE